MKARVSAPREGARPASPPRNRVALPHAAAMQRRFGPRVAHVPVFAGPPVAAILANRKADAAALGGAIFLKDARAPETIVAHELAHALQQYRLGNDVSSAAMLHALAVAPVLPAASPAEAEAQSIAAAPGPAAPVQAVGAGVAALRRTPASPAERVEPEALAPAAVPATPVGAAPEAAPVSLAPPAPAEPLNPTFAPPEAPDTTLDPAVAEARAAAAAQAEATMAAATTPSAAMAAYAAMAPSQQGAAAAGLGAKLGETAAGTSATLVAATPEVAVAIDAAATPLPEPVPLDLTARTAELVPDAAPAVVTIPDAPAQPVLVRPQNVARTIEQRFADGASQDGIFETLRAIQTENPGVVTTITDRASVPLSDDTDPALLDTAAANTGVAAAGAQGEAAGAVVAGRGPEAVAPRSLGAAATLPEIETRPTEALVPPPETAELERLALPAEVVAGFDAVSAEQMATSTAAAQAAMATAETEQATAHQTALRDAETGRAAAETAAQTGQRDAVVAQRAAIQNERQRTVTAQADAVAGVEAEAETARADHHGQIETQVAADRVAIDAEYNGAEARAAAEVAETERQAQAAREQADRDAANQSWWDRAADFIGDVFDALTSLIGDLFDAVRSVVGTILDAVGSVVKGLIDLAANAIKGLISALGAALKLLVDGLIGTIFPELAAELNAYIDAAVTTANNAVDAVADTLKSAVDSVVEGLKSALNSLLDVFQGAINAALALAQAALTGDWAGLLRKVLEAVLGLLGIEPAAFYELIAQASNAIETIVNDPGAFVGHLLDAVVGGIQRFVDNFGAHLQRGIISWLTGALGNITLPTEWNLAGVLDLARQVTGLTWDFVRERATRLIGAANVERLEIAFDWIATLVTEGFPALFQRIYDGLNDLTGGVLEAIRSFLVERVLMGAITWLASIFNPVGAIVKLVMTIWNIYQFLKNQLARIIAIVTSVVRSIAEIAAGNLEPAIAAIDGVLGNLLPVAIDLLMSLLGVTGVAARVREILQMVRDRIAAAIDALIGRVVAAFRGGRGAAAPGAATAAANDNSLGHPVPVDVEGGPDHTLSIDRTGPGGATVMLRTEPLPLATWLDRLGPLAARIGDATLRAATIAHIADARTRLGALETRADAAAAAARPAPVAGAPAAAAPRASADAVAALVAAETALAPILAAIFTAIGGAGAAFADQFTPQIEAAHPAATAMIRQELRTHAVAWAQLSGWPAVAAAMASVSELFTDPLDTQRNFGDAARTAIGALIAPVAPATAVEEAEKARILTYVRQQLRSGGGTAAPLHALVHRAILDKNVPISGTPVTEAIAAARTALAADGPPVNEGLRAALDRLGIIEFMKAIARGETVPGGTEAINERRLEQLWADQPNVDMVKNRFRGVDDHMHEWIPSSYIPAVIARVGLQGVRGEEIAEAAALWVDVQNIWRTPTRSLIFKPQSGRTATAEVERTVAPAAPGGAASTVIDRFTIFQGHAGAVYIRDPARPRPVPQTTGQGPWHDVLRSYFDASASIAESRSAVRSVVQNVTHFAAETIWEGSAVSGTSGFPRYADASGNPETLEQLTTTAANAYNVMDESFQAVLTRIAR